MWILVFLSFFARIIRISRFFFTLNYLFHVIIIIIIIIILLLLHIARASAQRRLMTLRLHRYLCLYSFYIWYYIHIYYVSRVRFLSERKSHMSLRKSVKWHFTLKFVFRQIQESRLLVRVVCMSYMFRVCVCVCVCVYKCQYLSFDNERYNCQFSKFTFFGKKHYFFFFSSAIVPSSARVPCKVSRTLIALSYKRLG